MKLRTKQILKRCLYVVLALVILAAIGTYGAIEYAKQRLFRDTPNTLAFQGELHPVPFQWSNSKYGNHTEPHSAILIPVSIPGVPNKLFMQFDTGAPDTFLHSGALNALKSRGIEFELFKKDMHTYIETFEINIAGNRLLLELGWVMGRDTSIDWEDPNAINIIGSLGADFLDQKICEIDFPAKEIRFSTQRSEALNTLGEYTPFKFKGRRILLPANIDGSDVQLFYDSGCSAFGLLTSKYHYDRLTDSDEPAIAFDASRHGDSVPIHHKSSDLKIQLGSTEIALKRISYAHLYTFLQSTIGRVIGGGFFGNKSMTECTLIIDTKANEFLLVKKSLAQTAETATEPSGNDLPPQN